MDENLLINLLATKSASEFYELKRASCLAQVPYTDLPRNVIEHLRALTLAEAEDPDICEDPPWAFEEPWGSNPQK